MSFIALLVALGLERLFSAQLHVREPAWLLGYVRAALRRISVAGADARLPLALLSALLPGVAVVLVALALGSFLYGVFRVAFAAAVLFFALGPRDLAQEVDEYSAALARGDAATADARANEILGHDARQRRGPALESVGEAVFVQANNRLFGVVFWFVVAGPFGALVFRVTDLLRREALQQAERADAPQAAAAVALCTQQLHGVLAWVPARLLALTYGVVGSFEESFAGWRAYLASESDHFFDANDRLLVHAGRGALGTRWSEVADEGERARRALTLAKGAFLVWLAVVAALTLVAQLA